MLAILEPYAKLMPFLRETLGPDYEIALSDVSAEGTLVAIENGYISGRSVGAPLSNLAKKIINNKLYQDKEYITSQLGVSSSGKPLRSCTYFIRDENKDLKGFLCINYDGSRFQELFDKMLLLVYPAEFIEKSSLYSFAPEKLLNDEASSGVEKYTGSVDQALNDIIKPIVANAETPVDQMTQDDKIRVVEQLNKRGVFYIKGAVSLVAEALSSSEATIYRYLSKINKK